FFSRKLGYKDEETALQSVDFLDHFYRQFELAGDRAGQHHALLMGLVLFDRARWTNKEREADVFRRWLIDRLEEAGVAATQPARIPQKTDARRQLARQVRTASAS